MVGLTDPPGEGPRLQDLVADEPLDVPYTRASTSGSPTPPTDPATAAALEQANAAAAPTARLTTVEAAYWTDVGTKEHLRWVLPHPEAGCSTRWRGCTPPDATASPTSRLVGMFRAHGLLVPVWDLPVGTGAEALEEPAERFAADLDEALADGSPLTCEERSAREVWPTDRSRCGADTRSRRVSTGAAEPVARRTPRREALLRTHGTTTPLVEEGRQARLETRCPDGGERMDGQLTVELADLRGWAAPGGPGGSTTAPTSPTTSTGSCPTVTSGGSSC